jgi:microcystin-dependent protein
MSSNSIHFSAIRFGNNVLYDTNLSSLSTPTVVFNNTIGVNTSTSAPSYIFSVDGSTKVIGTIAASNLTYGSSNLNNITVNQLNLQQNGNAPFLRAPSLSFTHQGYIATNENTAYKHLNVHGTIIADNLEFLGPSPIQNSNIYSRPSHQTFFISPTAPPPDTSNFQLQIPGLTSNFATPPQVFFNGFHLSYSNQASNDYQYTTSYSPAQDQTILTVTLNIPAKAADLIDIYVSPNYSTNNDPALLFQFIKVGPWDSNQFLYTYSNVTIAPSPPQTNPLYALTAPETFAQNLIADTLTATDILPEHITTSNITNSALTTALTLQLSPATSNLSITGNLTLPSLSFSNVQMPTAPYNLPFLSNLSIAPYTATPQPLLSTSNNYITSRVAISTSLPLTPQTIPSLTISGALTTTHPTLYTANNIPYLIPSNWTTSPTGIFSLSNVAINTLPLTLNPANPSNPPSLHIQGNVTLSNLQTPITTLTTTSSLSSPSLIGMVSYFAGSTPQPGWLECNGAYVSSNSYPLLYTYLQTSYGALSNEFFKLPDLRGEFIRSSSPTQLPATSQTAALQEHNHAWEFATQSILLNSTVTSNTFAIFTGSTSNAVGNPQYAMTSNETRPRNTALLACILAY